MHLRVHLCVFTRTVLLVSPDEDVPPEVQSVSEQLSSTVSSIRDVTITLIQHSFQAVLGTKHNLQALHAALQVTTNTACHFVSYFLFFRRTLKQASCSSRQSSLRSWSSSWRQ